MTKQIIKILAIETSCDETAASVIEMVDGEPVVLSNIISSQIDLHAKTGGVVPEVASRAHMEAIVPVVAEALIAAQNNKNQEPDTKQVPNLNTKNLKVDTCDLSEICNLDFEIYPKAIKLLGDITHIAVTAGPGLIGSLLVGFNAAKSISYARDLPIVPINHIEGHIYSAFAEYSQKPEVRSQKLFPVLALTVSGGHTSITLMKDHGIYETIGQTLDDAVGEAYDKVAKLLGLGYPGGPIISKMAEKFRNESNNKFRQNNENTDLLAHLLTGRLIVFPRPMIGDGTFNFSFSGLKTAVLTKVKNILAENNFESVDQIPLELKQEIAAAFEEAVSDVLCSKLGRAISKYQPETVVFAGGVSANRYLADKLQAECEKSKESKIVFLTPKREMCGDNAAMIGLSAYYHILRGDVSAWSDIKVDSNWELVSD
ncbi:MAG: tRNA (adenosine(37)-N6)-threonylcarbamoyltransferase complex transferase subunit TsaD [Candidatus Berkelbacteria bacterium]|nr:tRNA (adenosine(37)-N6)-threonylcarbamoyltransferase complex transferase subunit TsaD [Candidatus Berkelbacteria bacterium]